MSAFIIFTRDRTTNPAEMETYSQKAGPSLAGHPAKLLTFYGRQVVLEGPETEGTVILEFPTLEAAKAWYDSPAYTEARAHRLRGSEYRVHIVEGVA